MNWCLHMLLGSCLSEGFEKASVSLRIHDQHVWVVLFMHHLVSRSIVAFAGLGMSLVRTGFTLQSVGRGALRSWDLHPGQPGCTSCVEGPWPLTCH